MQETKAEMTTKNPKKANLLDHHSIKHILDESVSEVSIIPPDLNQVSSSFFFFPFFIKINFDFRLIFISWKFDQIVTGRGYVEDVRLSNVRLLLGTVIIVIALFAQFYKKKFPENRDFLIACIILYPFIFIFYFFMIFLFFYFIFSVYLMRNIRVNCFEQNHNFGYSNDFFFFFLA